MKNKKTILLTNDDGYLSKGIFYLKKSLSKEYNVYIVAPDRERSAVSMALTLNQVLRINRIEKNVYSVSGTPVDCINVAIMKVLPEPPDFIISGMNLGENISQDIYFSGTVGGAFSGYLFNIPSMAVSIMSDKNRKGIEKYNIEDSAEITKRILKKLIKLKKRDVIYNVNIPYNNNGKFLITSPGMKAYKPDIIEDKDPRCRKYYWIGTGNPTYKGENGTDVWAVKNGYISMSPIRYNLDCSKKLKEELSREFDEI